MLFGFSSEFVRFPDHLVKDVQEEFAKVGFRPALGNPTPQRQKFFGAFRFCAHERVLPTVFPPNPPST